MCFVSTENPTQWRCLRCCLVFRSLDFIKLHQATVCRTSIVELKMDKNIKFEENSLVAVEENGMMKPELKKLKIELLPGFSKNNFNFLKGARILHKWENEEGGSRWYKGKVTSVTEKKGKGMIIPEHSPVFEVWYVDDEKDRGPYDLKLLDDFPHDLRIVTLDVSN